MRKLSRITGIILIAVFMWTSMAVPVSAEVWEFGTEGPGKNPFTPRGYLVDTDSGQHWLSSPYSNSGFYVRYTGAYNGVDYLPAKKADGSNYTFYAMTDRNPWTDNTGRIGYGTKYFFAYKNGVRISNFNNYVKTPATRGDAVDPSGQGTCWVFKIEGFELDPGCRYEFGFLRGMQANNGITLVLARNEDGDPIGYIQETSAGLTSEERSRYNSERYKEFEFISSWYKQEDGDGYNVNTVPMRFTVQTYADLSMWDTESAPAKEFLAGVTEKDLKQGKYVRANIAQLEKMISSYDKIVKEELKYSLQTTANARMRNMAAELNAMLNKAKSEKPEPADMKKLEATIAEAEDLYARASVNVGIDIGQYGQIEVNNLLNEINRAKALDRFYPQSDIDAAVERLEDAMTDVRASKVMEEQMIFYDKVTGIYVISPVAGFPKDTSMIVRVMGAETDEYKAMKPNLSSKDTEAIYYIIEFFDGDVRVQPTKEVEIQIPVDDNISQSGSKVYSVGEKGKLTKINTTNANGIHIFKADKVGSYVMAGSSASDEEKAENRGEHMEEIMNQKKDEESTDNKQTQLEKQKKKKEEFRDPLNKILKRNENQATFSNDVRRETNPVYLIYIAAALALAAVIMGVRTVLEMKRKK